MLSSKSKIVITIYKKMKEMKTLKKFLFMSMMMLVSATAMSMRTWSPSTT